MPVVVQDRRCDSVVTSTKKLVQVPKADTPAKIREFIVYRFKAFLRHCFTAWWQAAASKECLDKIQPGDLVGHTDYAENYTGFSYTQLQSQYFWPLNYVLMPFIVRFLDRATGKLVKRVFFFMGDGDTPRNSVSLGFAVRTIIDKLRAEGVPIRRFIGWSDNCVSQFKCQYVVGELAQILRDDPELEAFEWNFFGEQHGKGEVDGAGGVIKSTLRRMQTMPENQHINTVSQFLEYLEADWATGKTSSRAVAAARSEEVNRVFVAFGKVGFELLRENATAVAFQRRNR